MDGRHQTQGNEEKTLDKEENGSVGFLKESAHICGYEELRRPNIEINEIWETLINKGKLQQVFSSSSSCMKDNLQCVQSSRTTCSSTHYQADYV